MRLSPVPSAPDRPPVPGRGDDPDDAVRHVQRAFLVVNGVPLVIGVVLSCSTAVSGVEVYGRLTLGVVWSVLQLGVFLVSAWWHENRSARLCEGIERPSAQTAGGSPAPERGW
ncbi:hypothetical protein N4P33_11655 [Streptomyces sp. 15-116A]|uniref:hypothetical protein n=1 Tax=Streptomyces sp. 15-116A TaxID=2259035 RepID=UPI0021B29C40|nr:hypothetical protein [Streptomyces sp. 15-116A]MCT7352820.1 hypothetical protein [Streptomyces sp. 15-116A]